MYKLKVTSDKLLLKLAIIDNSNNTLIFIHSILLGWWNETLKLLICTMQQLPHEKNLAEERYYRNTCSVMYCSGASKC